MDHSRTKTQPEQAALILCLFTISTSFYSSGCCARGPSPEICTGELAGAETTLDIVVTVTLGTMGIGQP